MEVPVFVARLERIDGTYVVRVPHDIVVQHDLHDGQTVSVVVESLAEYAQVDPASAEPAEARWRLNEDSPAYRGNT
jgi:hypothetical protein